MPEDEIWAIINSGSPSELQAMLKAANTTNTFFTNEMLATLEKNPNETVANKAREIEKLQTWMKKVAPIVIASIPVAILFFTFVIRR